MEIFTQEFKDSSKQTLHRVCNDIASYMGDAYSTLWIHALIWVGVIFSYLTLVPFAIYGANKWWINYSAINPNVTLSSTLFDFLFNTGLLIFRCIIVVYTLYIAFMGILYVYSYLTENKKQQNKPMCITPTIYPAIQKSGTALSNNVQNISSNPANNGNPNCPICGSNSHVTKNGRKRNGAPRYFCNLCKKEV
jgi:hypothetical protein